ncbi:MAG TPA: hypothetical protein DCP91_10570 [Eggerthellaceae bacterium]|nr:hypothetical protein [Eggerthellaceae bacterium]
MATAQLNVRIDAGLKAAGDAVLERFGVSSVQIVRSAWQYMVDHQRLPDFVQENAADRADRAIAETDAGAGMALRLAREAGLRADFEAMSYEQLRQSAYEEMLIEEAQRHA